MPLFLCHTHFASPKKQFFSPEQVQKVVLLNAWKIHIFPKWLISAEKSRQERGAGEWREVGERER